MDLKAILPGKLGFGAAPLGNMFRAIPETEAHETVEAAWVDGIRYFDNAPFYGAGLAEMRMGAALANKPRQEYVISTKVEPIELLLALEGPRPDGFLLAGRYSLLDHDRALQRVMPVVEEKGLGIVVGGPYSSGALVGGPNFEYAPATPTILAKVAAIKAIADRHGISMKAAGLQFALAHPTVAAVIPGASRPARIAEDGAALNQVIPEGFWRELREGGFVNPAAPLPIAD